MSKDAAAVHLGARLFTYVHHPRPELVKGKRECSHVQEAVNGCT